MKTYIVPCTEVVTYPSVTLMKLHDPSDGPAQPGTGAPARGSQPGVTLYV